MPSKDAHLYRPANAPSTSKPKKSNTCNPAGATFSSAFSSLLSTTSNQNAPSKPKQPRHKDDLAATSNRGAKKRALADMLAMTQPENSTNKDTLDEASWRTAKRKMDEKARLYAALKRGDVDDKDDRYGVDFDRKWAERDNDALSDQSESDQDEAAGADEEQVEYVDELGRQRKGSRKRALREERRAKRQARVAELEAESSLLPSMPEGVIYGDAVQMDAFDPDEKIAAKMAELASRRNKEETPPPDEHYDGNKEVRSKGTGFYQFSQNKEVRAQQMRELDEIRAETEKARQDKEAQRKDAEEPRKQEDEDRKKLNQEKESKIMADDFLDGLAAEIDSSDPLFALKKNKDNGEDG